MPNPQNNPSAPRLCPQCGAELPHNLPPDLCPKCLLKTGLDTQPQTGPTGTVPASSPSRSRGLPQPGEQLGHYRIVRSLGGGGMGTAFEAEDLDNGRRVALKVLSQSLDSPAARERFIREGRMAASINHPNSVYVFGTEEIGGAPVIAMELVAGGTLEDRVRTRGPMSPAEAVDAVLQIIAGLEAAQRIGILHRDVKPSNCFIDTDGTVKIGDFGLSISTAVRSEPALTAAGCFLGTPAFCSPEQLRGEELNARSDMYSVGATLFYLLTGRPPFQAKNIVALIATVLEQPAPAPGQFQPRIPRGLSSAARRCLEKPPGERFKNYDEMRRALTPFSSAAPVPAPVGLRVAAGLLDHIILGTIAMIIMLIIVAAFHPFGLALGPRGARTVFFLFNWMDDLYNRSSWRMLAVILAYTVGAILYYALLEGRWGATPGKFALGLRVVGPDNHPPGFWRALPRPLLYVVAPTLPFWLIYGANLKAYMSLSTSVQLLASSPLYILLALMFCTMRRKNGFAAVHDLVTKTRVISKPRTQARPMPAVSDASTPDIQARPLVGPYHVLETLETSAGAALLLGYDLRLLRKVWIRTAPAGAPPFPVPLRNLGRPGRLRWLAGRRSTDENWDAFEALSGQPLLRLLQEQPRIFNPSQPPDRNPRPASNPLPWAQVRYWLCDLASELSAAKKDASLPAILDLDRVWICADGRAKLLDFPAPGLAASPPMPDTSNASVFLGRVASAALEGRPDAASQPPGAVAVPLPAHVRKFLGALPQFPDPDTLLLALRPLLQRATEVTRLRRAIILVGCLLFPLFGALSMYLGQAFVEQWNLSNPGLFQLSQLLQQRSAMRRWPSNNRTLPTDRQFAIYISSHYRAAVTNTASWSSAFALSIIKGDNRSFAEQSIVQYPAPTDSEIAEADDALKTTTVPGIEVFTMMRQPAFIIMAMIASLAFYVALPAVIAALAFRGGLVLLAAGVTFVRRDGAPASRGRLLLRAVITWIPLLPALILSGFSIMKRPGLAVLAIGMLSCLAILSAALPKRGLQDRLAGTWPVLR